MSLSVHRWKESNASGAEPAGHRRPAGSSAERWKESKRHSFDPAMSAIINLYNHERFAALHSFHARGKHAGWHKLTVVKMPSVKGELFIREVCIADTQVYGYMQFRNISCQTCSSLLPRALLSHSFSMRFWGRGIYRVFLALVSMHLAVLVQCRYKAQEGLPPV